MTTHLVCVSKNNEFSFSEAELSLVRELRPEFTYSLIANNTRSLADVYNQFIRDNRQNQNADYIIFMHADAKLDLIKLMTHIESIAGKYDVMGLCGCSKFKVTAAPLNWFTGSKTFPDARWGSVIHGELHNERSFFNSHSPNITDHEVACIDGVCIIVSKHACENPAFEFDPQFTFSHYDTDISMTTILKAHLKLGVIVRDDLVHYSVGKSILTQEFLQSEKMFRDKWGF